MTNPVNTEPLTQEFLSSAKLRVVFEPKSLDEAEYVAQQLLKLGFRYYKDEYAKQLQNTLQGSLYLDTDKTIMAVTTKAEGIAATADDFALNTYNVPQRQSAVDVMRGTYALFPRTVVEGRNTLVTLREAGAKLPEDAQGTFGLAALAVYKGLLVKNGVISFAPASEDLQNAKVLTPADLGVGQSSVPPEQASMNSAFNEMAARMEQMAAQLTRLENEIIPKPLEKNRPALSRQTVKQGTQP